MARTTETGHSATMTTDHDEIRRWVDDRGGFPATVKQTGDADEPGILRIDFPDYSGDESLERIGWDEFFEKFEESNLAFLHQDEQDGKTSRFCKFVRRDAE